MCAHSSTAYTHTTAHTHTKTRTQHNTTQTHTHHISIHSQMSKTNIVCHNSIPLCLFCVVLCLILLKCPQQSPWISVFQHTHKYKLKCPRCMVQIEGNPWYLQEQQHDPSDGEYCCSGCISWMQRKRRILWGPLLKGVAWNKSGMTNSYLEWHSESFAQAWDTRLDDLIKMI